MLLRKSNKQKYKSYFEIKDFRGGSNRLLDEARVAPNEAIISKNLIQVQDGLWTPRWGTGYYGADIGDTIDGATEFVKSDGTTEVFAVSGGKGWTSTDGGAWTEITGATFTADIQCYFMQIGGFLYIANGTDLLARYDGATLTNYTLVNSPTGLSGTACSALSGTGYTYYAAVTALNAVGETVGSTEASCTVNEPRESWTALSDYITWKWTAVSNASLYQIYVSNESANENLLGSSTSVSYVDDGQVPINAYVEPPLENTTQAPKFKSMCISGNRIWATNDTDSKYKVHYSGSGVDLGKFSAFYGGGWINLEKGGRETPVAVKHYQSGTGTGAATVLCKTPEGRGAVWQISLETLTVGSTSFTVPSAMKVVGSFGTEAILGVVQTTNDIMFPNRRGWFNLGPQQNYYGILRTNELSAKIRPYWTSLNGSAIPSICSYYYDAKVFISVHTTSAGNDRMIIFDTERQNWNVEWTIGAKQFFEYTTTTGVTKLLYVSRTGNKLIELSANIQGDLGVTFDTEYTSGRYPIEKLWKDFEKVTKVFIKLGSPRGTINFEVSGTQKSAGFRAVASKSISPQYSLTGMGYDPMGSIEMGDSAGTATLFADKSDIRYVKIRKKVRDIQLRVTSNSIETQYILQGFIIEGSKVTGQQAPRSWLVT
jgi:hypothetical protein